MNDQPTPLVKHCLLFDASISGYLPDLNKRIISIQMGN